MMVQMVIQITISNENPESYSGLKKFRQNN